MTNMTALIAGATGAVAKRLVGHLASDGAEVVGLCRRRPADAARTRYVAVDLLDGAAVRDAVATAPDVTHVFYTARAKHGEGGSESVEDNVAMLRHILDAVEASCPNLAHVHLVEGGKWYGQHLGPYPTPAREDAPRHPPPNFYYDQQDLLTRRQLGKRWSWSASRPNVVCDFAPERPRNLVSIIGAYAAICRELGRPLDFPGEPANFTALTEVTDARHLARGLVHITTAPTCRNQAFNLTNGDVMRWQGIWPGIARAFDMPVGTVRPLRLETWAKDKAPVWRRIVERHGLVQKRLEDVALWGFGDFVFRQTYDVMSSTTRLRQAGFHEVVDSETMFHDHIAAYRAARILP